VSGISPGELEASQRELARLTDRLAERERVERDGLMAKIARREARIASLSETLARVEDAMGRSSAPEENGTASRSSRSTSD